MCYIRACINSTASQYILSNTAGRLPAATAAKIAISMKSAPSGRSPATRRPETASRRACPAGEPHRGFKQSTGQSAGPLPNRCSGLATHPGSRSRPCGHFCAPVQPDHVASPRSRAVRHHHPIRASETNRSRGKAPSPALATPDAVAHPQPGIQTGPPRPPWWRPQQETPEVHASGVFCVQPVA